MRAHGRLRADLTVAPRSSVRVLATGFTEELPRAGPDLQPVPRSGLTLAGHVPARQEIGQLQALDAYLFAYGPSMRHVKVAQNDLAFLT